MISISGLFAVTFSVVFAYVADVTDESNRTTAYGLVSVDLKKKEEIRHLRLNFNSIQTRFQPHSQPV